MRWTTFCCGNAVASDASRKPGGTRDCGTLTILHAPAINTKPLRIGLSARLLHRSPPELGFRGKTLQYLEQSVAHWILARGALAFMIPTLTNEATVSRRQVHVLDYAAELDGLVLQGGADVSPERYAQKPLRPEWIGDSIRDRYELELLDAFLRLGKPVLGICRGCQLINVAFGGTLCQDIETLRPNSRVHFDPQLYDELHHEIALLPSSSLATTYPECARATVSSIHHQCIDRLGAGLGAEAICVDDGVIEAVQTVDGTRVLGVQWHPEFHPGRTDRLDAGPLIDGFLAEAAQRH